MSFSDIFKKSFLQGFSGADLSLRNIVVSLFITCALAAYIFFIYRIITRKTFYSKNFNISLAVISVITASIILTIQSSLVVSLGMVGALSIVRFRTAIKDPMDLVFLFWSLSIGIICGAGLAQIAIVTSLIITAGIFLMNLLPVAKSPMILVINVSKPDCEAKLLETVKKYSKYYKVKSRNLTSSCADYVIEVRVKEEGALVSDVAALENVVSASLLSHDGEVTF